MRRPQNMEKIVGRVYQHDLTIKQVSNQASANYGKDFINGTIEIATDEEGLNVIPIHFTYVTEETAKGKMNQTYVNLKKIIEENKSWVLVGPEEAQKIKVEGALALNEFYREDGTLVSTKVNEGSFVYLLNSFEEEPLDERNIFSVDMVITGTNLVEKSEKNDEEYLTIKGAIFNFREEILPIEFKVKNEGGIKYFSDLGATNAEPIYTRVWGKIIAGTIVTTQEIESAFGEPAVKTYARKTKDWLVGGSARVIYDFGDENILTADELKAAMQNREIHLADIKKRAEEYKANKAATAAPKATEVAKVGGFSF